MNPEYWERVEEFGPNCSLLLDLLSPAQHYREVWQKMLETGLVNKYLNRWDRKHHSGQQETVLSWNYPKPKSTTRVEAVCKHCLNQRIPTLSGSPPWLSQGKNQLKQSKVHALILNIFTKQLTSITKHLCARHWGIQHLLGVLFPPGRSSFIMEFPEDF